MSEEEKVNKDSLKAISKKKWIIIGLLVPVFLFIFIMVAISARKVITKAVSNIPLGDIFLNQCKKTHNQGIKDSLGNVPEEKLSEMREIVNEFCHCSLDILVAGQKNGSSKEKMQEQIEVCTQGYMSRATKLYEEENQEYDLNYKKRKKSNMFKLDL